VAGTVDFRAPLLGAYGSLLLGHW